MDNPPANAGDLKRLGSIPGLGRSPRRRPWQPPPASHGQRGLAGCSPWGRKDGSGKSTQHNIMSPSRLHFFLYYLLRDLSYFMEFFLIFFFLTLASTVHNFQIGYVFPPSHPRRQTTFSSHAAPPAGHF